MSCMDSSRSRNTTVPGVVSSTVAVALFLGLMAFVGNFKAGMLGSALLDADSYERLLRVERLLSSGSWYDNSTPWADSENGELHWTRPLDILIAAAALPLSSMMPLRQALTVGAYPIPVVLGCLLVLAIAWAARPRVGPFGVMMAGFVVASQFALSNLFRFSYVDHHALILLLLAIGWAGTVRSFDAQSPAPAVLAGIAAGLGVWVSVESLVWVGTVAAALALLWIAEGTESHLATLRTMFTSAAIVGLLALVAERPPSRWLAVELDRISTPHVVLQGALAMAWIALSRGSARGAMSTSRRAVAATAALVVPVLLVLAWFPRLIHGPLAGVDPRVLPLLFENNSEFTPLSLWNPRYVVSLIGALIPLLIGTTWSLAQLVRGRDANNRRIASLTLCFAAVFVPLALYQWRWIASAAVVATLPWILAIRWAYRAGEGAGTVQRLSRVALAVTLAVGHLAVSLALMPAASRRPANAPAYDRNTKGSGAAAVGGRFSDALRYPQCNYAGLGAALSAYVRRPATDLLVLAPFFEGPQVAWQARLRVVSGPYHRNGPGILDTVTALSGSDDAVSRDIVGRRGVDFVVLCVAAPSTLALARADRRSLAARLLLRRPPEWLVPLRLRAHLDRRLRVWRVTTARGAVESRP